MSFDPWHVTRSPPIGKRISVGRYNKKVCLQAMNVVVAASGLQQKYRSYNSEMSYSASHRTARSIAQSLSVLIANEARSAELAIIIPYPTSANGIIVLLKMTTKHHEILLISLCKKKK